MVRKHEADEGNGYSHQLFLRRGCFSHPYLHGALTPHQGGAVLGNGTWLNVGGNQAVTYGGVTDPSQTGGPPYDDPDGGQSCVFSHAP